MIVNSRSIRLRTLIAGTFVSALAACNMTSETASTADVAAPAANVSAASTFARFVPERKDDFAWENDMIAFRAYGPAARSGAENAGVDCWLKRVDYPIINKWYDQALNKGMSYHEDHGEGLDNYHVGSSAGCGGTSLWLDGKRQPLEAYTKWEILSASPEKTVFVLTYENEIAGSTYQEEKKITIEVGKRLYKAESTFYKDGKPAANLPITVGLTTHDEAAKPEANVNQGWLSTWEALGDSELGTAVILDPKVIVDYKVINSGGVRDEGHALLVTKTDAQGKVAYYAGYGWKKAGAITTLDEWQEYLSAFTTDFK